MRIMKNQPVLSIHHLSSWQLASGNDNLFFIDREVEDEI
jgi:hypothetical protein